MKNKSLLVILFISISLIFVSCDNDEEFGDGKVLFCTNSHIINCVFDIEISVDNKVIGHLDASSVFSDTICQCESSINIGLLLNLETGTYSYTANEINCIATNKVNTWTGQFVIDKDDCTEIFLDITP